MDDRHIARRLHLFAHTLDQLLVHIRCSLGVGHNLVTLFAFLPVAPLEVLVHFCNLLLDGLARGLILLGDFLSRLQLLLEGLDPVILGRQFPLKALAKC